MERNEFKISIKKIQKLLKIDERYFKLRIYIDDDCSIIYDKKTKEI
ncbi:hypothetical protein LCGC14_2736950 [marine sediment metagenome]|uniref:Uncharacterized protein n=1 Tax=marine sediment metagenome TaxID=412755 RepID=A0A0F9BXA2_9ZZZZ